MAEVFKKRYDYKVSRDGTYLGKLPFVTSEFSIRQNLYSVGAQLEIVVGETADTANQAVEDLLDEAGNALLAEDGAHLTTERVADIVGDANSLALIRNDNTIEVVEYSAENPNGKTVFSGYMSKWKTVFGGADNVVITCLSLGQDLAHYINAGSTVATVDSQQTTDNDLIYSAVANRYYGMYWTVGGGVTNLTSILLRLDNAGGAQTIVVSVYNNLSDAQNGVNVLGTVSQVVNVAVPTDVTFTFATPLTVVAGQQYFFMVGAKGSPHYNNASGTFYTVNVGSGNIANTGGLYYKTYYGAVSTQKTYTSTDPSTMLSSLMTSYIASGGDVSIGAGFSATGVSATYTFNIQTLLEVIQKVQELGPSTWYWYVDPATNILYYKNTGSVADHTMVKGVHINQLSIEATKEDVVNVVYFTGGEKTAGVNVYVNVNSTSSLAINRRGVARINDPKVKGATGDATGTIIANNYIAGHNAQKYITEITISARKYDISTFDLGELIGFGGFGTFVDNLLLQIVGISRNVDDVTLSLGVLPSRATAEMDALQRSLNATQTTNNPNTPS